MLDALPTISKTGENMSNEDNMDVLFFCIKDLEDEHWHCNDKSSR